MVVHYISLLIAVFVLDKSFLESNDSAQSLKGDSDCPCFRQKSMMLWFLHHHKNSHEILETFFCDVRFLLFPFVLVILDPCINVWTVKDYGSYCCRCTRQKFLYRSRNSLSL